MDLSKLNGSNFEKVFDDVANIADYQFKKASDVENKTFKVVSVYITKGKFGFQSVLILENENEKIRVGFSNRNIFDNITTDKDVVNAIKNKKIECTIKSYISKNYNKKCYKPIFNEIKDIDIF